MHVENRLHTIEACINDDLRLTPERKKELERYLSMSAKPSVLHLGHAIKYNHDFYNNQFLSRFNVVQATETDRESFI
jgi:hypothetical protein